MPLFAEVLLILCRTRDRPLHFQPSHCPIPTHPPGSLHTHTLQMTKNKQCSNVPLTMGRGSPVFFFPGINVCSNVVHTHVILCGKALIINGSPPPRKVLATAKVLRLADKEAMYLLSSIYCLHIEKQGTDKLLNRAVFITS